MSPEHGNHNRGNGKGKNQAIDTAQILAFEVFVLIIKKGIC